MRIIGFLIAYLCMHLAYSQLTDEETHAICRPHWECRVPLITVYAVRGNTVRLPCNISPKLSDSVVLILWYKQGIKTPVFSIDSRNKPLGHGKTWSHQQILGGRAKFEVSAHKTVLLIEKARFDDDGLYRCRVDYKTSQTHIGRVRLHVVDPPRSLKLFSSGVSVHETISVLEGKTVALSCRSVGGDPHPNVTWWSGNILIDDIIEDTGRRETEDGTSGLIVENVFNEEPVTRGLLKLANLTCLASNNPEIEPLAISTRLTPLRDSKLHVNLTPPPRPLMGGKEYEIECEARGVKPAPIIKWRISGKYLSENIAVQHIGKTTTRSILRLKANSADDRSQLDCTAIAPSLSHLSASDSTVLTVNYVPEARMVLSTRSGSSLENFRTDSDEVSAGFKETEDVSFTCITKANPPTYNTTFLFNGRSLHQEERITVNEQTLTLRNLKHSDAGLYTCVASNSVGDGQSNAVGLHIDFQPVCSRQKPSEIVVLIGEKIELTCKMTASPADIRFTWRIERKNNGRQGSSGNLDHIDEGLVSRATYVIPNVTDGYTVQCLASNNLGSTNAPCIYDIRIVDIPGPLEGCKQDKITSYSASVSCSAGNSGGLAQNFHLQIKDIETNDVVSTIDAQTPHFKVTTLDPGRAYAFSFHASNTKGSGRSTTLIIRTLSPQAEKVAPEEVVVKSVSGDTIPPSDSLENIDIEEEVPWVSVPVIAGVGAGFIVGLATVVSLLVRCHCSSNHGGKTSPKARTAGMSSKESLISLQEANVYVAPSPAKDDDDNYMMADVIISSEATLNEHRSSPVPTISTSVKSSRSSPEGSPKRKKSFRSLRFKEPDIAKCSKVTEKTSPSYSQDAPIIEEIHDTRLPPGILSRRESSKSLRSAGVPSVLSTPSLTPTIPLFYNPQLAVQQSESVGSPGPSHVSTTIRIPSPNHNTNPHWVIRDIQSDDVPSPPPAGFGPAIPPPSSFSPHMWTMNSQGEAIPHRTATLDRRKQTATVLDEDKRKSIIFHKDPRQQTLPYYKPMTTLLQETRRDNIV